MFIKEETNSKMRLLSKISERKHGIRENIHFPNSLLKKQDWSVPCGITTGSASMTLEWAELMRVVQQHIMTNQSMCCQKDHLIPKLCHRQIIIFLSSEKICVIFIFHCSVTKTTILEPDCLSSNPISAFINSVNFGEPINPSISLFLIFKMEILKLVSDFFITVTFRFRRGLSDTDQPYK